MSLVCEPLGTDIIYNLKSIITKVTLVSIIKLELYKFRIVPAIKFKPYHQIELKFNYFNFTNNLTTTGEQ